MKVTREEFAAAVESLTRISQQLEAVKGDEDMEPARRSALVSQGILLQQDAHIKVTLMLAMAHLE